MAKILDTEKLRNLWNLYTNNLIIGYLNINRLRNEITQQREVCRKGPIDLLRINETKVDDYFPNAH